MTPTKLTAEVMAEIRRFHRGNTNFEVRLGNDIVGMLFDHIDAIEQERDQAREALLAVEWDEDGKCNACRWFGAHRLNCIVGKALSAEGK